MPVPLVAAALASIAPALAQRGLDLLSGFFRGAVDKGTQQVAQLIEEKTGIDINDVADNKLTDDQWVKLKEFEFQHQAQLLQARQQQDANALEEQRLLNADRERATRLQEKALDSNDPFVRRFIYYYAIGLTVLAFTFIFYASFIHNYETHPKSERIIDTVMGFLLGVTLSAIIQYFFGSSLGSKSKEKQLNQLTDSLKQADASGSVGSHS